MEAVVPNTVEPLDTWYPVTATLSVEEDQERLAVVPLKEAERFEGTLGAVVSGGGGTVRLVEALAAEKLLAASKALTVKE